MLTNTQLVIMTQLSATASHDCCPLLAVLVALQNSDKKYSADHYLIATFIFCAMHRFPFKFKSNKINSCERYKTQQRTNIRRNKNNNNNKSETWTKKRSTEYKWNKFVANANGFLWFNLLLSFIHTHVCIKSQSASDHINLFNSFNSKIILLLIKFFPLIRSCSRAHYRRETHNCHLPMREMDTEKKVRQRKKNQQFFFLVV